MINAAFTNRLGLEYKIIAFDHRTPKGNYWRVQFTNTGYCTVAAMTDIKRGRVKDRLARSVAGVGYYGAGEITYRSTSRMYRVWHNMINRCYNPKSTEWKHYGACGVTVCDRWHCFLDFAHDVPSIPGYDEELFESNSLHLDKDFKQWKNQSKQYGPDTCVFITPLVNANLIEREHKAIIAIDPDGQESTWESVRSFLQVHSSFRSCAIYQCLAHVRAAHKQWKFDYCNDYRKPIDDGVSRVALREIRMGEVQSI